MNGVRWAAKNASKAATDDELEFEVDDGAEGALEACPEDTDADDEFVVSRR